MTKERAQEILKNIESSHFGWNSQTEKFYTHDERKEIVEKWNTMPGYTCFADALRKLANPK